MRCILIELILVLTLTKFKIRGGFVPGFAVVDSLLIVPVFIFHFNCDFLFIGSRRIECSLIPIHFCFSFKTNISFRVAFANCVILRFLSLSTKYFSIFVNNYLIKCICAV
jgi:hypothetical protein